MSEANFKIGDIVWWVRETPVFPPAPDVLILVDQWMVVGYGDGRLVLKQTCSFGCVIEVVEEKKVLRSAEVASRKAELMKRSLAGYEP